MVLARCRYTQLLATQGPPPFCCPPAGGAGQGRAGGGKDESVGDYQERKATTFLPATSEPGPVALRTPGWVWVPQHQDASVTLEEAYPFMVEGSLRSDGMFVDQDLYSGGQCLLHPLGALYPLDHHRPESGAGTDRQIQEVIAGEIALYAVVAVRATRLHVWRPQG